MTLLAWFNVVFYIPLVLGLLMTIGSALGLVGTEMGDVDADGDVDSGVDVDVESDTHVADVLDVLGFGKCPASIVIMTMLLLFGGIGVVSNIMWGSLVGHTAYVFIPSFLTAFMAMFFGTAFVARTVSRLMPTMETKSLVSHDFVGHAAQAIYRIDSTSGAIMVRIDGDVFLRAARTATPDEAIEQDQPALIVSFDESTDTFIVAQYAE